MERLSNKTIDNAISGYKNTVEAVEKSGDTNYCTVLDKVTIALLEELKEYEDAEEQGLLLRLPVAEGSIVFVIATIYDCDHYMDCLLPYDKNKCDADIPCEHEHRVYRIKETKFNHCMLPNIGKTVFLTKEEAEQKLESMRGGE